MFLMWSSALLTIVCLYLSYQLLTTLYRNYRRPLHNGLHLVFDGSDEFVAFKELTGESDDAVIDTFLLACDGEKSYRCLLNAFCCFVVTFASVRRRV